MGSNNSLKDTLNVHHKFKQGKLREDFHPNSKAVMKYCEYCGESFWTNRPNQAKYCNLKSTCRVYALEKRREIKRARELISILKKK